VEFPLVRRRELLAAGYADDELRRGVRAGLLAVVRRGTYVPADAVPDGPEAGHALRVCAALPEFAPDAVVSHVSAAVLHGLPVWGIPLDRVHLTRPRRSGARRGTVVHVHAAPVDADEVVGVHEPGRGGLPVTSVARTVVDLARELDFERAVAVADAALHRRLVTPADLARAMSRARGRPGAPAARRVVAFADGRSESVGESRSRVAISAAGLPVPLPQWEVFATGGRRLGRVDFGWPDRATVGEFDGRVKYGSLLAPGQEPGDAVFAEKRREDALRDAGLRVVRWTWSDLADFAEVAGRLRRALR
jgi:hypothetical protein